MRLSMGSIDGETFVYVMETGQLLMPVYEPVLMAILDHEENPLKGATV